MVEAMNKDTKDYKAAEKVNRKKMDASSQSLLLLLLFIYLFIITLLEQVTKIVERGFYLA